MAECPRESEPEIKVTKVTAYHPVAVDADGTPLEHGERMVETEPGVWMSPWLAAALPLLAAAVNKLDDQGT